jgi:hypothetical protein
VELVGQLGVHLAQLGDLRADLLDLPDLDPEGVQVVAVDGARYVDQELDDLETAARQGALR